MTSARSSSSLVSNSSRFSPASRSPGPGQVCLTSLKTTAPVKTSRNRNLPCLSEVVGVATAIHRTTRSMVVAQSGWSKHAMQQPWLVWAHPRPQRRRLWLGCVSSLCKRSLPTPFPTLSHLTLRAGGLLHHLLGCMQKHVLCSIASSPQVLGLLSLPGCVHRTVNPFVLQLRDILQRLCILELLFAAAVLAYIQRRFTSPGQGQRFPTLAQVSVPP